MITSYKYKVSVSDIPINEKDILEYLETYHGYDRDLHIFIYWKIYNELKDREFQRIEYYSFINRCIFSMSPYGRHTSIEFKMFVLQYVDNIYGYCKYLDYDKIPLAIQGWCRVVRKLRNILNNPNNYRELITV